MFVQIYLWVYVLTCLDLSQKWPFCLVDHKAWIPIILEPGYFQNSALDYVVCCLLHVLSFFLCRHRIEINPRFQRWSKKCNAVTLFLIHKAYRLLASTCICLDFLWWNLYLLADALIACLYLHVFGLAIKFILNLKVTFFYRRGKKKGTVCNSMVSCTSMHHLYRCKKKVEGFCSQLLWFHSCKDAESPSE